MIKTPRVAIIIPTYNNALYISKCIECALNQDYPNFEVIVIDDCSTDNTEELVKKYPVKYIKNNQNRGASYTRNLGAEISKEAILVYLDSDIFAPPPVSPH